MNEDTKTLKQKLKNSIGGRLIIICILVLLLNIPLGMVDGVIFSRSYLYENTMEEISRDWGGSQTIIGPILTVPVSFKIETKNYNSKTKSYLTEISHHIINYQILPENLKIKADIVPEIRHRGIFDVLVQSTNLSINGNFAKSPLDELKCDNCKILWDQATLNLGINPELVRGDMKMIFDEKNLDNIISGTKVHDLKGLSFKVDISNYTNNNFNLGLMFNSSGKTSFAPVGKKTTIDITSTWAHPKFSGTFRPDNPKIAESGFEAEWNIPHIARNYPQLLANSDSDIREIHNYMASVELFEPLGIYKKVKRLANYGIMFIALTFIMMLLFEVRLKQNMHFAQYLVIGLAVIMFFITTLSLSEYLPFDLAYLIASAIVILLISLYIFAALHSKKAASIGGVIMIILYGILYIMLSEADYALLIGTFILLATISAIMWETRNINRTE